MAFVRKVGLGLIFSIVLSPSIIGKTCSQRSHYSSDAYDAGGNPYPYPNPAGGAPVPQGGLGGAGGVGDAGGGYLPVMPGSAGAFGPSGGSFGPGGGGFPASSPDAGPVGSPHGGGGAFGPGGGGFPNGSPAAGPVGSPSGGEGALGPSGEGFPVGSPAAGPVGSQDSGPVPGPEVTPYGQNPSSQAAETGFADDVVVESNTDNDTLMEQPANILQNQSAQLNSTMESTKDNGFNYVALYVTVAIMLTFMVFLVAFAVIRGAKGQFKTTRSDAEIATMMSRLAGNARDTSKEEQGEIDGARTDAQWEQQPLQGGYCDPAPEKEESKEPSAPPYSDEAAGTSVATTVNEKSEVQNQEPQSVLAIG